MIPGEYFISKEPITANAGRDTVELEVSNSGDRPIQVGSHTHFFESNRALVFDREKAYGFHLNIPAGTSVRFEPGDTIRVELVAYGGSREVWGFLGFVNGNLEEMHDNAIQKAFMRGFERMEP